ncbi:2-C-methyl-D-erythritol 4-phosphate cytidylyltransferase [Anaerosporobacter faecicola]|uniref:2-C-methyl-D-erythritol 4-phosphate cytidylyltransferase n=1 Tax=Anaerosporobacter faecicola TaxID=2718714 RepID=UPI001438E1D0|nr:2-C-methyl-D-erythritol 4-phosphate cytidylyltransferase [Anaerosporobacter faecicola]
MKKEKYIAIILAAGQGSRMQSNIAKQYMELHGKPMLYYSLAAFEKSNVDHVMLVVGKGEMPYCQKEIIDKYGFHKVKWVIEGGSERYLSVYRALEVIEQAIANSELEAQNSYVLIHDAARPLINENIIMKTMEEVCIHGAVAVGVPSKDTIKIADTSGNIANTPKRSLTYIIQTPQAFSYTLLIDSYRKIMNCCELEITDDAMVVESGSKHNVKIVEGEYTNMKVTTPEDVVIAELLLNRYYK